MTLGSGGDGSGVWAAARPTCSGVILDIISDAIFIISGDIIGQPIFAVEGLGTGLVSAGAAREAGGGGWSVAPAGNTVRGFDLQQPGHSMVGCAGAGRPTTEPTAAQHLECSALKDWNLRRLSS